MKKLYRYVIEYKTVDSDTSVVLQEYNVVAETEKTYFIDTQSDDIKRVLKLDKNQTGEYTKRFAYATKKDAMLNFVARTKKRIRWYEFWIKECKKAEKLIIYS